MVRRGIRRAAVVLAVVYVVVGVAYLVKTLALDGDETVAAAPLRVQVLAPGSFESAHPYAPYYVVPSKRFADPSKLTRVARNKLLTNPESALNKGAMAGSPQIVRLALRATQDEPVTIEAVRFSVVSDARPLRGWFTALPGCMVAEVQRAKVDLDARRAAVRYIGADDERSSRTLELEVGPERSRVIELQAATRRRRVAWTAQLAVRDEDGDSSTVTVDDGGKPFRVTSARDSRSYRPIYGVSGIIGYERQRGFEDC